MKTFPISIIFLIVFSTPSRSQISTVADRPADYEYVSAPDSAGQRLPLKRPVITRNIIKLPYPILFIHGLNSNSETWNMFTKKLDDLYGLAYGGRMDYCLNFDLQNKTSNTQFGSVAGGKEDIGTFSSTLLPADYYYLNFDVGYDGSFHPSGNATNVLSNQSAIAKQGMALRHAIKQVLKTTGKNKVILVGHSMGGLASREYLQNKSLWQADGEHHIAKLVTTGTPHGGSNTTSYGMGIGGINEQSEAVRDLRSTYYYSMDRGVYLWGGKEEQSSTNMYDNIKGFYNADVNSNGIDNELIQGLNEKELPLDLDHSSIVGLCSGCLLSKETGDGIVTAVNAELKKLYAVADIHQFYYSAYAATEIHTALPDQLIQNMQALDEPNAVNLAYEIEFDKRYTAFTTVQSVSNSIDNDAFKFNTGADCSVTLKLNKTDASDLLIDLYDSGYNKIFSTVHTKGLYAMELDWQLNAGMYYLVFSNMPNATSYLYPYDFILNGTINVDIEESGQQALALFPNPVSSVLNIRSRLYDPGKAAIEIFNGVGELMVTLPYTTSVDISALPGGIYLFKITETGKAASYLKFVKR